MGLGLEWKQELSEKSSMCLTNRGRSNFVKNVVVFIQSENKEININQKTRGHGLCDEIDRYNTKKYTRPHFGFRHLQILINNMGVQIETMKEGDGATFPQKGQKVFINRN